MFINPKDLKASQLKAIVALYKHNKPCHISAGYILTKSLNIRWNIIQDLLDLKLIYKENNQIKLTPIGCGLGKLFSNKTIIGTD